MKRLTVLAPCLAAALAAAGCGSGAVEVKGVLTMDGKPVEGATVTYTAEDGSKAFSGMTDSSGAFSLEGSGGSGALPGEYKVVVVKASKIPGVENMSPESGDYKKMMEKMGKQQMKPQTGPAMPPPPGSDGDGVKTELPAVYANVKTTPLTAKVPPPSQPVQIELKSRP